MEVEKVHNYEGIAFTSQSEERLLYEPSFFNVATHGVTTPYARHVAESIVSRVDMLQQSKGYTLRTLHLNYLGTDETSSGQPFIELIFTSESGARSSTYLSFSGSWRRAIEDFMWVKRNMIGLH
jgi:hypothetical protein